ncbi:MAG: hypothetical protein PF517_10680 [Salinivirgaceae bacterium]|jgi:hypothetical protein|nr:hypothetical protein [Salinivirgaceae bacterium]
MKNLKHLMILLAGIFLSLGVFSQETEKKELSWYEKGTVYGTLFGNFNTLATDFGKESAFEVQRAYFGYKYTIDDRFSTNVKLDMGNDKVEKKRSAFFKNAYLQYKYDNLKVQVGLADAFQFKTQEKFFGYRYVVKSFQDTKKFGASADLGMFAAYKISDLISTDVSLINGEGYGVEQEAATNNFKTTFGLTMNPVEQLVIRFYGDALSFSDTMQTTLVGFVGVKLNPVRFGVEYVMQTNHKLNDGNDYSGISFVANVKASDKINVFGRFDMLSSVEIDNGNGGMTPWNESSDGNFLVAGCEYAVSKNVKFALNYQHTMHAADNKDDEGRIFLNLQASF